MRRHLVGLYPIHNSGGWHAQACVSVCEFMISPALSVELYTPSSDPLGRRPFTRDAIPRWLKGVAYRLDPEARFVRAVLRRRFRAALGRAHVAYLWAGVHEDFYSDVRGEDVPLCIERINCHRESVRPVLEEAYRRIGLTPPRISDASIAEERRKLDAADWIFAPSPAVRLSLLRAGVAEGKILSSSYGWSPERTVLRTRAREGEAPITLLFVGNDMIRKGAHLLLDAWAESGVRGRVKICGRVQTEMRTVAEHHLARPDVFTCGYVEELGQTYADADILGLPTVEEGSPLVIYEAMAHGLAILTTPAGASGIVRDGIDGLVCEPYDRDAWITNLRRLASDAGLRARLGAAARERAAEFTWAKVGARRREALLAALERKEKDC